MFRLPLFFFVTCLVCFCFLFFSLFCGFHFLQMWFFSISLIHLVVHVHERSLCSNQNRLCHSNAMTINQGNISSAYWAKRANYEDRRVSKKQRPKKSHTRIQKKKIQQQLFYHSHLIHMHTTHSYFWIIILFLLLINQHFNTYRSFMKQQTKLLL